VLLNLFTSLTVLAIAGTFLMYVPSLLLRFDTQFGAALLPLLPYSGVLMFVTGLGLSFSGTYYLMRRGDSPLLLTTPPRRLVVAGPYSHLQHPILLGVQVMLFGEALWLCSPSVGLYAVVWTVLSHYYVAYVEEPRLVQRFGVDYRAYRHAVPRWLPQLTASNTVEP